jgi:hypothetical protein
MGVNLTGVHLTGVHLTGVHLTGVHLTDVASLTDGKGILHLPLRSLLHRKASSGRTMAKWATNQWDLRTPKNIKSQPPPQDNIQRTTRLFQNGWRMEANERNSLRLSHVMKYFGL